MEIQLNPGERIIKEGAASLQKGIEAVGGRLFLTDQRLVFVAHTLNVQKGWVACELTDIQSTKNCWTKLLGVVPIMPTSLAVCTGDGSEYRFIVNFRNKWATAIHAQKNAI